MARRAVMVPFDFSFISVEVLAEFLGDACCYVWGGKDK